MRRDRRRQIGQGIELLKLAGLHDGQEAFDGPFALIAARAKHDFAPLHGGPERALGGIVGGRDALLVHEGEEVLVVHEEHLSQVAHLGVGRVETPLPNAKRRFSIGRTWAISSARVRGDPRAPGSPRKRCHSRNSRRSSARAWRQKRIAVGEVARSRALRRLRVRWAQQNWRWPTTYFRYVGKRSLPRMPANVSPSTVVSTSAPREAAMR